jgi:two-component sensor histidine kinase
LQFLSKNPLSIAVVSGSVLLLLFLGSLVIEHNSIRDAEIQNIRLTGELLSDLFQQSVLTHIETLENLKRRIEETEGDYFNYWEYDAQLILHQYPSFNLVEWIDSSGVIRRVEPQAGNEQAVGLDILALDYRSGDWLKMKTDSLTNMTPWTGLVQGGGAFLVDVPLYYGGEFRGSITGGLDFTDSFNRIMAGRDVYNIEFMDDKGTVFYKFGDHPVYNQETDPMIYRGGITLNTVQPRELTMTLVPGDKYYTAEFYTRLPFKVLLRFFMAVLFGGLVFYYLKAFQANQRNRKSLHEKELLISEIHHRVKNNLAVISGLIEIQVLEAENADDRLVAMLRKSQHRINSIAGVHELLYDTENFDEIPIKTYVKKMFDHLNDVYNSKPERISLIQEGNKETININQAIPLGMMISELMTNSFKHAFSKDHTEEIRIRIDGEQNHTVDGVYSDSGPGFPETEFQKSKSIGFTLIKTLLNQLDATYKFETQKGIRLTFSFTEQNVRYSVAPSSN